MDASRPNSALEQRIGYRFEDPSLLDRALAHRSWAHDHHPPVPDNERLEFLGDAVLGLVVAERLFEEFAVDEGRLTRARAGIVRRETLAAHARAIRLGEVIKLGRGEETSGGRDKDSILADCFEALLGAIYRDGGFEEAQRFIGRTFADILGQRGQDGSIHSPRDARTTLQELLQRQGQGTPRYRIVSSEGPPHDPTWTLEVLVGGEAMGTGTGRSKQEAAREAANVALDVLNGNGQGPAATTAAAAGSPSAEPEPAVASGGVP